MIVHVLGHGRCNFLAPLCHLCPRHIAPGRETQRFHTHLVMFVVFQQLQREHVSTQRGLGPRRVWVRAQSSMWKSFVTESSEAAKTYIHLNLRAEPSCPTHVHGPPTHTRVYGPNQIAPHTFAGHPCTYHTRVGPNQIILHTFANNRKMCHTRVCQTEPR